MAAKRTKPAEKSDEPTLSIEDFETVDFEDATDEFENLADNIADNPEEYIVRVYRGDLATDRFRPSAKLEKNTIIVVDGNLRVSKGIELAADQDDESAMTVFVVGDVAARDVMIYGDPFFIVGGSVTVNGVVVVGGGNIGHITVEGDLRCRAVLQFTDGQVHVTGKTTGAVFAMAAENVTMPSKKMELATKILRSEVLTEDGAPDRMKICKAASIGKPVLAD